MPTLVKNTDTPNLMWRTRSTLFGLSLLIVTSLCAGCCSMEQPKAGQSLANLRVCPDKPIPHDQRVRFNYDGHMYTTFLVGSFADLPTQKLYILTYYSQLPDMDCRFDATHVSIVDLFLPWRWGWRRDITEELHSLHGGDDQSVKHRREALGKLIREKLLNGDDESLKEAGLLIHAFGDSYAHTEGKFNSGHEQAYGTLYGHLLAGHHPDEIAHPDVFQKYEGYVHQLFSCLNLDPKNEIKGQQYLEAYLCSLSHYVCANEKVCDDDVVETMARAITTWSTKVPPGFSTNKLEAFVNGPQTPPAFVQNVMDEIKQASSKP